MQATGAPPWLGCLSRALHGWCSPLPSHAACLPWPEADRASPGAVSAASILSLELPARGSEPRPKIVPVPVYHRVVDRAFDSERSAKCGWTCEKSPCRVLGKRLALAIPQTSRKRRLTRCGAIREAGWSLDQAMAVTLAFSVLFLLRSVHVKGEGPGAIVIVRSDAEGVGPH